MQSQCGMINVKLKLLEGREREEKNNKRILLPNSLVGQPKTFSTLPNGSHQLALVGENGIKSSLVRSKRMLRIKATQRIEHIISIYNRGKEYRISTALSRYPAIGYQATRIRTREPRRATNTSNEYDPEGLRRTRVTNTTPKGYEHEKRRRPRRVTNRK